MIGTINPLQPACYARFRRVFVAEAKDLGSAVIFALRANITKRRNEAVTLILDAFAFLPF